MDLVFGRTPAILSIWGFKNLLIKKNHEQIIMSVVI